MELEQELQQGKFTSELHKMALNIMYTGNWLTTYATNQVKPYGLSLQQFNILRILRGQHGKPVSIGLILERMLDKSSNVTRLVDKLQAKGLVSRHEAEDDRRRIYIQITDKGLELLQTLDKKTDIDFGGLSHITEEEARAISELLNKVRNAAP